MGGYAVCAIIPLMWCARDSSMQVRCYSCQAPTTFGLQSRYMRVCMRVVHVYGACVRACVRACVCVWCAHVPDSVLDLSGLPCGSGIGQTQC